MTGKQNQVIPGLYRQHILAGVIISGQQPVRIDTHGGGTGAEGSHITATFGQQLMITLYDLAAATVYSQAWLAPENQWVFKSLPAEIPTIHGRAASDRRSASAPTAKTSARPGTTRRPAPRSSGSGH